MTWVKICGTTNRHDAQSSVAAGADALGFIFAPSPRSIELTAAADIIAALSGQAEMIGVFVNESPERIADVAHEIGLTGVQLHGDEAAETLPEFRRALGSRKIIKVLHADDLLTAGAGKLSEYLSAQDSLDAILLDSGSAQQRGGTGIAYDWSQALPTAARIRVEMPLIVAGGLNSSNVAHAIELFDPYGIDVASGVESRPGIKDETMVKQFITAVRKSVATIKQKG